MKRFEVIGNEWCELDVKLTDKNGKPCLRISGSYGRRITRRQGKKMAREYWESFFEECPEELGRMAVEYGKRTPRSAARYVQEVGGVFHGLDVHKEDEKYLYLVESCGQICDELVRFFPGIEKYLPYHLNDMKAGCEHQEKLGLDSSKVGFPCPECGYEYGTKWLYQELPQFVLNWASNGGT